MSLNPQFQTPSAIIFQPLESDGIVSLKCPYCWDFSAVEVSCTLRNLTSNICDNCSKEFFSEFVEHELGYQIRTLAKEVVQWRRSYQNIGYRDLERLENAMNSGNSDIAFNIIKKYGLLKEYKAMMDYVSGDRR